MHTTLEGSHAIYHLPIDNDLVAMNGLVGQKISLKFNGEITIYRQFPARYYQVGLVRAGFCPNPMFLNNRVQFVCQSFLG
jgi:hypothetical protein